MKILQRIWNNIKKFFSKKKPPELELVPFVISDKQRIDGSSTISFFVNNPEPELSVTRTFSSEGEVVTWLMNNGDFRRMLFEKLFPLASSHIAYHCGVKEPIIIPNKKPGDIDILLYEQEKEKNAIGIECKIVKSESREHQTPKINKIVSVHKKGTLQANGYAEIGFSRVFLFIVILDDGRHYKNPNFIFRSTPSEFLEELYGFDWNSRLNEDTGIIYVYVNQFTTNHINQTKGLGLQIVRAAKGRVQDEVLTAKIKSLTTED